MATVAHTKAASPSCGRASTISLAPHNPIPRKFQPPVAVSHQGQPAGRDNRHPPRPRALPPTRRSLRSRKRNLPIEVTVNCRPLSSRHSAASLSVGECRMTRARSLSVSSRNRESAGDLERWCEVRSPPAQKACQAPIVSPLQWAQLHCLAGHVRRRRRPQTAVPRRCSRCKRASSVAPLAKPLAQATLRRCHPSRVHTVSW